MDNLAPEAPGNPRLIYETVLAWDAVEVEDLAYYSVYVSPTADFASYTLVGRTTDESHDVAGTETQYLAVAASDFAGNEGEFSATVYNDPALGAPDVTRFSLRQSVPNPFNPRTTISYDLPQATAVRLAIYDLTGRMVRQLRTGAVESPGRHGAVWNGNDDLGRPVSAGVYIYRLEAGSYIESRRLTLVR